MASHSALALGERPSAIAVHDDGNMPRNPPLGFRIARQIMRTHGNEARDDPSNGHHFPFFLRTEPVDFGDVAIGQFLYRFLGTPIVVLRNFLVLQ